MKNDGRRGFGLFALLGGAVFLILAGWAYHWITAVENSNEPFFETFEILIIALYFGGKWFVVGSLLTLAFVCLFFVLLPRMAYLFLVVVFGVSVAAAGFLFYPELELSKEMLVLPGDLRDFTSRDGKTMRAALLFYGDGLVTVKREDGRTFESGIDIYSDLDQRYIRAFSKIGAVERPK